MNTLCLPTAENSLVGEQARPAATGANRDEEGAEAQVVRHPACQKIQWIPDYNNI